jgi:acetoin utilization deacetylase AcuC-like enzyme
MNFYSNEIMLRHEPHGPERPDRLRVLFDALAERDETIRSGARFDRGAVERIHRAEYVDEILAMEGRSVRIDLDTDTSPGTVLAARAAVGCSLAAVRDAVKGEASWAMVRPPGHHAEPSRAMGFCFFNNIAIAAEEAISRGAERVLIVDWDVHHGNGTQAAFYDRPDVFYFSTHQWPLFPGTGASSETGEGRGEGATLNVPMPAGCGDDDYIDVYDTVLRPATDEFQPDLILVSAGFDAHRDDPLAGMEVTAEGFGRIAAIVGDIAADHCDGRLGLFLEGGYDLDALSSSVLRCIDVLT